HVVDSVSPHVSSSDRVTVRCAGAARQSTHRRYARRGRVGTSGLRPAVCLFIACRSVALAGLALCAHRREPWCVTFTHLFSHSVAVTAWPCVDRRRDRFCRQRWPIIAYCVSRIRACLISFIHYGF